MYGRSNEAGQAATPALAFQGTCSTRRPCGGRGKHGATRGEGRLGPPFAPETEPAPRGRATDTGYVYTAPMPERKSSVKPGKECLLWNPRSS